MLCQALATAIRLLLKQKSKQNFKNEELSRGYFGIAFENKGNLDYQTSQESSGFSYGECQRVAKGDTLDFIADKYMKKNTYGKREHNEFKQGIIELNKWPKFFDLKEGDMLVISYWKNRG